MAETIKIKMTSDYLEYQKGQIYELSEKIAVPLLTNGKALKIHRLLLENKKSKKNDV